MSHGAAIPGAAAITNTRNWFAEDNLDVAGERPLSVVLLSGGMDSGVCAALAARDTEAAALHVSYGQRTEDRERRAFEEICERLGIRRRLAVRNEALRRIGGSALTDKEIAVPEAKNEIGGGGVPGAEVAFRYYLLFAGAGSWGGVVCGGGGVICRVGDSH